MEEICEICQHLFVPKNRGCLPRASGKVCEYCREAYAAY